MIPGIGSALSSAGGWILEHPLVALLILAVGGLGVQSWRVERIQDQKAETELELVNTRAALDSTRDVTQQVREQKAELADGVQFWQRQAHQAEIEKDEVAEALDQTTVALSKARIQLKRIQAKVEADSATEIQEGDVRVATFHHEQPPATLDAKVRIPPPPELAQATFDLRFQPIRLTARVLCGEPRAGEEVRPASVNLEAPSYTAGVTLADVQADPQVCNPGLGEGATQSGDSGFLGHVADTGIGCVAGSTVAVLLEEDPSLEDAGLGCGAGGGVGLSLSLAF